jgi:hypothetical protein
MARGITESFQRGKGIALQQQALQQQNTQNKLEQPLKLRGLELGIQAQESEQPFRVKGLELNANLEEQKFKSFMRKENLLSVARGARSFLNLPEDEETQNAFLNKRIAEIKSRDGDPIDSQEMLATPFAERKQIAQDALLIAQQEGLIKLPQASAPPKKTRPIEAVNANGERVFLDRDASGEFVPIKGFKPIVKKGEQIVVGPNGGVTISRGNTGNNKIIAPKGVSKKLTNTISSGIQTLGKLARIEKLFDSRFLTAGGALSANISSAKSKLGFTLDKDESTFLKNRVKFRNNIKQFFNTYKKEITGSAAAVQEIKDLQESIINENQDPVSFQASLGELRNIILRNNRVSRKILREGGANFGSELERHIVSGLDDDPDARGEEIMQENPDMEFSDVVIQLRQEGYEAN